jgi:hypothetical protein
MLQSILSSVTFRVPIAGARAWTNRNKKGGKFMAVRSPAKKKKAAKKLKGVRAEKGAGKKKSHSSRSASRIFASAALRISSDSR